MKEIILGSTMLLIHNQDPKESEKLISSCYTCKVGDVIYFKLKD
jgi:hypothetical protein